MACPFGTHLQAYHTLLGASRKPELSEQPASGLQILQRSEDLQLHSLEQQTLTTDQSPAYTSTILLQPCVSHPVKSKKMVRMVLQGKKVRHVDWRGFRSPCGT